MVEQIQSGIGFYPQGVRTIEVLALGARFATLIVKAFGLVPPTRSQVGIPGGGLPPFGPPWLLIGSSLGYLDSPLDPIGLLLHPLAPPWLAPSPWFLLGPRGPSWQALGGFPSPFQFVD